MKLKSLLLFGGMLAVTSTQATLTVTERTLTYPQPASTALVMDGTTEQYLYNVGTQSYFPYGDPAHWNTRAAVNPTEGYKVKIESTGEGTVAIIDYPKAKNEWLKIFADDTDGIWIDNNNGNACDSWVITPGEGNNFTISNTGKSKDGNTEYTGLFLGAVKGSDIDCYLKAPDTENFQYTFYAVSPEEYDANIALRKEFQPTVDLYNASVPLWNALVEADALGVPGLDAYETIYANEASTAEELSAAVEGVKDAIKTFQAGQASVADPKDMSSLITNADFTNGKTGWSGTSLTVNYNCAEIYCDGNKNLKYDAYQQISGMPVGVYALTSQAYYRAGFAEASYTNFKDGKEKNALLYAVNKVADKEVQDTITTPIINAFYGIQPNNSLGGNEKSVVDGDNTYYVPDNMATAKTYFDAGFYKDNKVLFAVSEGTAVIGVKNNKNFNGAWSIFNNFGLTFYGNGEDAYQLWNDDIIKNLPVYNAEEMQVTTSVVEAYEEAKTNAAVGTTYEAVMANIASVNAAQAAIDANIAAWQSYKDEISSAQLVANNPNYNGEDMDALNDYLMEWPDMYLEEKTLTTDEIIAEAAKLKGLREAAIANSISEGTDVTEWLKNVDFAQGSEGWTATGGVAFDKNAKCAEAYDKANFDIYQAVENAPIGVYEISVQGFYRYGRDDAAWQAYFNANGEKREDAPVSPVYVYMNDMKTPLANVFDYQVPAGESYYNQDVEWNKPYTDPNGEYIYPNNMADAGLAFDHEAYKVSAFGLVAQKGDAMRVGVKGSTSGANWAIFTRFKLTYQGFKTDVVKPALETTIAGVDLTKVMGSDVKTKAQELITTANATLEGTDGKAMFDALAAIVSYSETIDKSVTLFSSLSTKMQSVADYVESSEAAETVKADVAEYLGEVEANMATYTDAQANEAIEKLEECRYKLALPAGYENATDEEPVNLTALIQTPSFEKDGENSIEGWEGTTGYNFGNDATQKAALAVEFYEKDFDMYQDIKVPANGMYQVTVRAFDRYVGTAEDYAQYAEGTKSLAELYAKTGENEVVKPIEHLASDVNASTEKIGIGNETSYNTNDEIEYFVPNDMVSAVAYFSDATAQRYLNGVNIKVTDGTLRIGIRQADHKNGCWVIMDDFQLWYLGADSQKEEGGFTDVKGVETVSEPVKVEIYSIDGIKRSAVQNGLNVVVTTDADGNVTAKTVVVKK